jgi:hypothetical protein
MRDSSDNEEERELFASQLELLRALEEISAVMEKEISDR